MKPKIYIFSIFSWKSNLLHREHMLAKSFSRLGYEVYFVERGYKNIFRKPYKENGINVVPIFGLPYFKGLFRIIFRVNDVVIGRQINKMIKNDPSWIIISSPLWSRIAIDAKSHYPDTKIAYDISDDHLNFATNNIWRNNLENYEKAAIEAADYISVTSKELIKKIPPEKKCYMLENGVDLDSFRPAKPILKSRYEGKIVGFIGGVYKRVDLELVGLCAKKYPEAQFVIVGPTDQEGIIAKLSQLDNLDYLGPVPWGEVQNYFASLDVGLVPFVSEKEYPWLKSVDSVKVYQYAYFGYPIVTTEYGNVDSLREYVYTGKTRDDFVRSLGYALTEGPDSKKINLRKSLSEKHDWLSVADSMAKGIEST